MRGHLIRNLFAAASLLTGLPSLTAQVAKLDDTQFRGNWHEIQHIPDKREKQCARDTVLLAARGDKDHQFLLTGACVTKNGQNNAWNFTAAPRKHHQDGALRIPFLYILHHQYWVYAFDPAAGWAVVGTPNHKQLWIYSRQSTLAAEALSQARSAATSAGFQADKLIPAVQDQ